MENTQIEEFLNYLVLEKHVAAQTQALALNALCFLYRHIIKQPISVKLDFVKSLQPRKLPVVLTQDEVVQLIEHIPPQYFLCEFCVTP